ncbi:hypothetical protein A9404_02525 [Halothiobacillus diazotrophicus]|uniref:Uncharacterized protein n=1 Tax=Halothiobacillus diazotrophicus TaxID=1860122 RepID=A0A191ZEV6_9GAMM|nr:DUF58 domain-containing protein [Halothiobacillus diazotrophicus]ANJ66404.1 hypothetical protein A9404_02525 [Halothiobacillus diazotrophicus]
MQASGRVCTLKPNRIGLAFIALAIVMLLAAINYGNNLVFFISFLLIALMGNSAWQTRRQLRACTLHLGDIPPRHAGDSGSWSIRIESSMTNPALTIRPLDDTPAPTLIRNVQAGVPCPCSLTLASRSRGYHSAPDVEIATNYPIGLWTARCRFSPSGVMQWVYPRLHGSLPLPGTAGENKSPEHPNPAPLTQTEFDHLRAYVPGDPLAHVAFKQWAKTGNLVTRQHAAESGIGREYVLDFNQIPGQTEQRLEQLAAWIVELSVHQAPYILRLPGQPDHPGLGAEHQRRTLEVLTRFRLAQHPYTQGEGS